MSFIALRWAVRQRGLPITAKLLLVQLAEYASDHSGNETCWPSVNTLVLDTGLSRASIFRALAVLEQASLIAREGRTRSQSTMYLLKLDAHTSAADRTSHTATQGGRSERPGGLTERADSLTQRHEGLTERQEGLTERHKPVKEPIKEP